VDALRLDAVHPLGEQAFWIDSRAGFGMPLRLSATLHLVFGDRDEPTTNAELLASGLYRP